MIDTEKYHKAKLTEGPWKYKREEDTEDGDYRIYIVAGQDRIAKMITHTYYDAQLIADAPLLLAEVKQIHEILAEAYTSEAKHSCAEYLNMIARVTGLIE